MCAAAARPWDERVDCLRLLGDKRVVFTTASKAKASEVANWLLSRK